MSNDIQFKIGCDVIAEGKEEVKALLDILEEGLDQCKCGKGYTTEELKERLKKRLTKWQKDDIIPTDINN